MQLEPIILKLTANYCRQCSEIDKSTMFIITCKLNKSFILKFSLSALRDYNMFSSYTG